MDNYKLTDSRIMNFVCEEMSSSILQELYDQKKASKFCDLTLLVNNKVIKAHRNVLASSSPYFGSILKRNKIVREELIISCGNIDMFNAMINFMYTGKISIEHSTVEDMLKLADHFLMTKVIEYCIEFLGTKLNISNCIFTYNLTQRNYLKQLGSLVENWIVNHLNEIYDCRDVLNVQLQDLLVFLKNKVFALSVPKMLKLISDWIMENCQQREKDYPKLLSSINWTGVLQNEIYEHIEMSSLYTKSELCFYYFLNNLAKFNILVPNFKARYDLMHAKFEPMLRFDEKSSDCDYSKSDKITVTDRESPNSTISIKARHKNRKQQLLRRLMYNLKPSLRVAALKVILNKKKFTIADLCKDDDDKKLGVKCPICFTNINDSMLLEQHLALSHAKDVTYKCGICAFVCQYHGDYLNHMKTHFVGPPYKCDFCESSHDQITKLISHRISHLDDSQYQCTMCAYRCRSRHNYVTHLKLHTNRSSSSTSSSAVTSTSAAIAETKRGAALKCAECGKQFKQRATLDAHVHSCHGGSGGGGTGLMSTCEECGYQTRFGSHMVAHKRMHNSDIYRCSYPHCKYSTSKKSQLTAHSKTHSNSTSSTSSNVTSNTAPSGNNNASATINGVASGNNNNNNNNNSNIGNSAVRPHRCAVCGRGFMEKSHLVRHERIHLQEKPFKCGQCEYASSRRDKLKEHHGRHHGEHASAKVPYKARPLRRGSKASAAQPQEPPTSNSSTYPNGNTASNTNGDIQEMIMHHQSHSNASASTSASNTPNPIQPINPSTNSTPNTSSTNNYHHFNDNSAATSGTSAAAATDFHHHHHQLQQQMQHHQQQQQQQVQVQQRHGNMVNHHQHMLAARASVAGAGGGGSHATTSATTTAAAVAAAMMLDPRFHHNSAVPYHPSNAMTTVQTPQQMSNTNNQHSDYTPTSLQNCMTLF